MEPLQLQHVYVIHVRTATAREQHIRSQLERHGIAFRFILDGDIPDLDAATLARYFAGPLLTASPISSCTLKHLLAYEAMVRDNVDVALICEDDIYLADDFNLVCNQALRELKTRSLRRCIVSLENSTLKFVPQREVVAGQLLYRRTSGRCAGAYLIDRGAAEHLLLQKCDAIIDWWHNACADRGLLNFYWCHPPIAEQGSHNGQFNSLIDHKPQGLARRLAWSLQKQYKQLRQRYR